MRKNSIKNNRINSEMRKVLTEAIRESKDPRISAMTSVTEAIVAPDLKTCKVYISVFGTDEELEKTMEGLNSASGFLRSEIARVMNMRYTPALTFIADRSAEYAVDISAKIEEVMERDRIASEGRDDSEDEGKYKTD